MTHEEEIAKLRRLMEENPGLPIEKTEAEMKLQEATMRLLRSRKSPATPEEAAEQQRKFDQHQREMRVSRAHGLMAASGIPKRHADKIRVCQPQEARWGQVFSTVESRIGSGFIVAFLGRRGTGKTQLAATLIMSACHRLIECRYVKAMDFFREFRATFREDGEREYSVVKRYSSYGLLVIDEAHERGHTDFESRTLANIIDHRYDQLRDTILISNESLKAFQSSVGPSISSRLNEVGEVFECDWESYR